MMPRVTNLLRRAAKSVQDLNLFKVLESELNHELASMRFQGFEIRSAGDFILEWDSPWSQDVVLRKKGSGGEEIAVSALLGGEAFQGDSKFPRQALMKVCVKKEDLSSILHFDCVASSIGEDRSDFDIWKAHYIQSNSCLDSSVYRGPVFSDLDPTLQRELKQFLASRGIEEKFTNFLLLHLHRKEQDQYMNWLQKLKDSMNDEYTSSDHI
ncbi:hypothetical protein F511_03420 [Dorcoceras hygrometricum]|uniref:Mitochondrial glycoprotein family protein n=1 Tax=Dorcoceras hygrometricum TaxID=472368 RepID=A0A2Z7DIQ0_9LAMI|nr:hypothetical protein F511_03420 [Dorcoceras hygrometricum]